MALFPHCLRRRTLRHRVFRAPLSRPRMTRGRRRPSLPSSPSSGHTWHGSGTGESSWQAPLCSESLGDAGRRHGAGSCPSTGPARSAQAQGVGAKTLGSRPSTNAVQSPSCACRWGSPPVPALGRGLLERLLMLEENQRKGLDTVWFWSPPVCRLALLVLTHHPLKNNVVQPQRSGGCGCCQALHTAAHTRSHLLGPQPQKLRPLPAQLGPSGICSKVRECLSGREGRRLRLSLFPSPPVTFQPVPPLCQRRTVEPKSHGPGSG